MESLFEYDSLVGLFSSVEKCVEWIKQFGRGWEDTADYASPEYTFVVMSLVLDYTEEHQPIDEIYRYDKFGQPHRPVTWRLGKLGYE